MVVPLPGSHVRLLGLCGPPGVGKSTLRAAIAAAVPGAVVVPLDGFHLANRVLEARGLRDRKGAPETFDAEGYAALLSRIRAGEDVVAPCFERDLEQALAGAIEVPAMAPLVITEGNYLLLDEPRWAAARGCLDEVWFLDLDDHVRRQRLLARHIAFGKTPDEARAWVTRVDEPNAQLVLASRERADRVVDVASATGTSGL